MNFYTPLKKGDKKCFFRRGNKFSFPPFSKVYKKLKCQQQKVWNLVFSVMYFVSVYPMDRTYETYF